MRIQTFCGWRVDTARGADKRCGWRWWEKGRGGLMGNRVFIWRSTVHGTGGGGNGQKLLNEFEESRQPITVVAHGGNQSTLSDYYQA